MKIKIRHFRLLVGLIILLFVGCKRWIELPPPSSLLSNASVFSSDATATAAQLNIYSGGLQSESWNMSQNCGLLCDELYGGYSRNTSVLQFYLNSMLAINGLGPWKSAYNYIYQANAIIDGLNNSTEVSEAVKRQLMGESKFIRGFWYFYLINCYGEVPWVWTTDYKINSLLSRSSSDFMYKQVVSDLNDALNLLNSEFVDATDTAVTSNRVRPTKWAAMAMLARTYLYTSRYDSALKYSDLIISNASKFSLVDSLDDVFIPNSMETIWQLATTYPVLRNTVDGNNFILTGKPGTGSANTATISNSLLNDFEIGDKRKLHWIASLTVSGKTYYFPYKYKAYRSTIVTEQTTMLRLAEQYLIRAEAKTYLNEFDGAMEDINIIRHRAGLPNYTILPSKDSLILAIMKERRAEYFAEWGHRWFDLKRTGIVDAVMTMVAGQKGGAPWINTKKLFPVPQSERDADPFLSQNEGY